MLVGPVRTELNKEFLARARFIIVPSSGPAVIVGGPRLGLEAINIFVRTNLLSELEGPATAHVLQLRALLYKGPSSDPGEVWGKNLFDLNMGDIVRITKRNPPPQSGALPSVFTEVHHVAFPFCMEIGTGAKNQDVGGLLVSKTGMAASKKELIWCDCMGRDSDGLQVVASTALST